MLTAIRPQRVQLRLRRFILDVGRIHAQRCVNVRRFATPTETSPVGLTIHEAMFYIDSVFPVRFGAWDLRYYIGYLRQEYLLQNLQDILSSVKTHDAQVVSIEPRHKDGGVFVKFKFLSSDKEQAVSDILKELEVVCDTKGGLPSWVGLQKLNNIWQVKGKPWMEDLDRYASAMLKVNFDGPDIREEDLYAVFRPFGRIVDITSPAPAPVGSLRYSIVTFRRARSAVAAHNCIHDMVTPISADKPVTRLLTSYERPLKPHAVRDWIAGHPKLVVPVLVFLLGTITYTIFDPIRALSVEGKVLNWFDYRKFGLYQWFRDVAGNRLSLSQNGRDRESTTSRASTWRTYQDAEKSVRQYLGDPPTSITFVHGPPGSGKSRMLSSVLNGIERPVLTIDCAEIYKANSDSQLLSSLARQTGYWPSFPFVNAANNLVDIASVGLIGQKAGLSASLETQVKQILDVVSTALKRISPHEVHVMEKRRDSEIAEREARVEEARRRAALMRGTWHDPRLDCIAGSGVMSELGLGDERMRPEDYDAESDPRSASKDTSKGLEEQRSIPQVSRLQATPVVVIKNFDTKRGKDDVIGVLAKWAAALVDSQVAHVIVLSDNRENVKVLAQALPSKPLNSVALSDADAASALSFVTQKLQEIGRDKELTYEQRKAIEKLGGRSSDLEIFLHKVQGGQSVEDAVEDLIARGVSELRKKAFGEDLEDAKNLPWKREEAWVIFKQLANAKELFYHKILYEFPFKGDETALRNMERADLLTIGTHDGRPSVIKPGKPIYQYVFARLATDPVFCAAQELGLNLKRIAAAEQTVRACEDELRAIADTGEIVESTRGILSWLGRKPATVARATQVLKRMQDANALLAKLDQEIFALKKILAKYN